MKLATFTHDGRTRVGAVDDDRIADLSAAGMPATVLELLEGGAEMLAAARTALADAPRLALADVRLEAPITRPPKILAVGLNYRSHAAEVGMEPPKLPVIFNKQSTSVTGPHDDVLAPHESEQLDYEGELGFVIGKRCRRVTASEAPSVVAGFTVVNDVSVRDWQLRVPTMTMGKSWDTHCPFGPWIVTSDELADPHDLRLRTWVNDDLRQDARTSDLVFDCWQIVEHLSTAFTLEPGDLVATGTPSGVAVARKDQPWLVPGDRVRVEIESIGTIDNRIVAD